VNAEFNVWLLIVGLVVGAGLTWVVTMDGRRRDAEIDSVELPREAAWLSAVLAEDGYEIGPDAAEQLLLLHRDYLAAPPPDAIADVPGVLETEPVTAPERPPASKPGSSPEPDGEPDEETPAPGA
jgi:hypothetical protein